MRAWAGLVIVALAAAGCTAKQDAAVSEAVDVLDLGPSAEELARTPAILRGVVTSEALTPVANATLSIERLSLIATTDAGGVFVFPAVPAGEQEIVASAPGYATRTVRIAVANGTTLEMNLTLFQAPSLEPYAEVRELKGFLACGLLVVAPTGEERRDCAAADPNHRDSFEVAFTDDAQGAVFELVWDPEASPAARTLRLLVETVGYGHLDAELGNATGEGRAVVSVPLEAMRKYYPEGGAMRAIVLLEGAPAAAAFQATFTLYVTGFYHAPAPEGYTVLKG